MIAFAPRPWRVDASVQDRLLRLCDIDPDLYGQTVDPSAFTAIAIQEAIRNEIAIPTGVHSGQILTVHRDVQLDEDLTISGGLLDAHPTARGQMVNFVAELADHHGIPAVRSVESFLILDPAASRTKSPTAIPDTPAPTIAAAVTFQPDRVTQYCGTDVNPVHFDPAAAHAAGFRAPIIGGEQGVRSLVAALWTHCRPRRFEAGLRFLRPIFWDDQCELTVEQQDGCWTALALAKAGKPAARMTIRLLAPP